MTKNEFIEAIAKYVKKYAYRFDIKVHSPIIAQAILESGWGTSSLAKHHNYFGMKCGGAWTGKRISKETGEEYTVGIITTITADFRGYDSMEEGVKGYFEFINYSRYANLKGVTDPFEYIRLIKADGYATSSTYVEKLTNLINQYDLTKFDTSERSEGFKTGSKIALNKTPCYETSTAHKNYCVKTGSYYIWSSEVVNGRIRITNSSERVGVKGQVTCWIDVLKHSEPITEVAKKLSEVVSDWILKNNAGYSTGEILKAFNEIMW